MIESARDLSDLIPRRDDSGGLRGRRNGARCFGYRVGVCDGNRDRYRGSENRAYDARGNLLVGTNSANITTYDTPG